MEDTLKQLVEEYPQFKNKNLTVISEKEIEKFHEEKFYYPDELIGHEDVTFLKDQNEQYILYSKGYGKLWRVNRKYYTLLKQGNIEEEWTTQYVPSTDSEIEEYLNKELGADGVKNLKAKTSSFVDFDNKKEDEKGGNDIMANANDLNDLVNEAMGNTKKKEETPAKNVNLDKSDSFQNPSNNNGNLPKPEDKKPEDKKSDASGKDKDKKKTKVSVDKEVLEDQNKKWISEIEKVGRKESEDLQLIKAYNTKFARVLCLVARDDTRTELTIKSFKKKNESNGYKYDLLPNISEEKLQKYKLAYIDKLQGIVGAPKPSEIFKSYKLPMFTQKAPSGFEGAVIKMPKESQVSLLKLKSGSLADVMGKIKAGDPKEYTVLALTKKSLTTLLLTEFEKGRIEEIVSEPYTDSKGNLIDNQKSIIQAFPKVVTSVSSLDPVTGKGRLNSETRVSYRHEYRPKLFTKTNYVPLNVFSTYEVDTTKDLPADIQDLIYKNEINPKVISATLKDQTPLIDSVEGKDGIVPGIQKDDEGKIVNRWFATGENRQQIEVFDWYDKSNTKPLTTINLVNKVASESGTKLSAKKINITKDDYPVDRFKNIWDRGVTKEQIEFIQDMRKQEGRKSNYGSKNLYGGVTEYILNPTDEINMSQTGDIDSFADYFEKLTQAGI